MIAMLPMFGTLGLVIGLAIAAGNGSEHVSAIFVAMGGGLIVSWLAKKVANDEDRLWLPTYIMGGYTAKILASWMRWWVLVDYYNGSGDAVVYHNRGILNAELWRSFDPPPLGIGTEAMEGVSGLVYIFYAPNFLGGFFMFATLAFFGQLLLYSAFRTTVVPRRLKLYALAIFFVPNVVYWPSSPGKESIMMLGLGMSAYGVSKLLAKGSLQALVPIGAGLVISGIIRPHVSAMQIAAATLALLFAKRGAGVAQFPAKRLFLLGLVGAGLAATISIAAANFGISLDDTSAIDSQVNNLLDTVEEQTEQGGSSVSGSFISSPAEFPEVFVRVLFRPLPTEAHNGPALAASLEGTLLLAILLWRLPWILRRGLRVRCDPYILFSLFFIIGFVIAFSSFLNLGLMARERSMVMPYVLALVVALGFGPPDDFEEDADVEKAKVEGVEALLLGSAPAAPADSTVHGEAEPVAL